MDRKEGRGYLFLRAWGWFVTSLVVIFASYSYGMGEKEVVYQELSLRKNSLELEKQKILLEQEDLFLRLENKADPKWVEMVLMHQLGMVPEGQVKVYFALPE